MQGRKALKTSHKTLMQMRDCAILHGQSQNRATNEKVLQMLEKSINTAFCRVCIYIVDKLYFHLKLCTGKAG